MLRALAIVLLSCTGLPACAISGSAESPLASGPVAEAAISAAPTPPVAPEPPPQVAPVVARRDLALPLGWETLPAAAFEEALARWNPQGATGRLDADALAQLGRALDGATPRALRAVLLLAHSAAPEAWDALVGRLERRVRPADDAFPAVDVAAAAALARARDAGSEVRAAVLEELGRGRRPHPLLPVRVECAAAALELGRETASTFLLSVLREGTEAQDRRVNWPRGAGRIEDLAFAQWRAASALARRAGVPDDYRPEASAVDRARAADELERALLARGTDTRP